MYNKSDIIQMLENSDTAVQRGLIAIWERQTASEKLSQSTHLNNSIGFNGFDAQILSSFAEQFQTKGWLSAKQMVIARKRMKKYAGQLAEIANAKMAPVEKQAETIVEASECEWSHGIVRVQGEVIYQRDLKETKDNEGDILFWEATVNGKKFSIIND